MQTNDPPLLVNLEDPVHREANPLAVKAWSRRGAFKGTPRPYETGLRFEGAPVLSISRTATNLLERAVADTLLAVLLGHQGPTVVMRPLQVAGLLLDRTSGNSNRTCRLHGLCALGVLQMCSHILAARADFAAPSVEEACDVEQTWVALRDTVRGWLQLMSREDVPEEVRALAQRMATGTLTDAELADAMGSALAEPVGRAEPWYLIRPLRRVRVAIPGTSTARPPISKAPRRPSAAELLASAGARLEDVEKTDVIYVFELPDERGDEKPPALLAVRHGGHVRIARVRCGVASLFRLLSEGPAWVTDSMLQTETRVKATDSIVKEARAALRALGFPDADHALRRDRGRKAYATTGLWKVIVP